MKARSFSIAVIGIWLICLVSLVGIRLYKGKRPNSTEFMVKGRELFLSLNDEEKANVVRYDSSILRLHDGSYHLVGLNHENEDSQLISDNMIAIKKVDFIIEDPILLQRRYMVSEAFKTLNDAEKKCFTDRFASIIYRNGEYFLYYDRKKHAEYIVKYGTECKQCEELKKNYSFKKEMP